MPIELRPLTVDDATEAHRITRAAEVADGSSIATTLAEIELRLAAPHMHLEADSRLALLDGEPAGFAYVDHTPSGARLERAYLLGEVDPAHRRRGVGSSLFEWQRGRAHELLSGYSHDLPRYARTDQKATRVDTLRLYERFGLTAVRYTDELIRPLDASVPSAPLDGPTVVAWDRSRSDEVRAVKNAAFADHWGSTPSDGAAWAHMLADDCVRLDLSVVALVDDRVVGYALNEHYAADEEVTGRRDGWIGSLGVLRDHRGRGVASALIAASIDAFRGAGFTHAMLGVDTENPSGAYGLYRRLGFEPLERSVTHEVEVPRAAPGG
ncbi:MAG: GNAT family N-acetyltransferase [Acidimicrobiales bacterium]